MGSQPYLKLVPLLQK